MEEIQTKKLNLRALKKPSSEELNSSNIETKTDKDEDNSVSHAGGIHIEETKQENVKEEKNKEDIQSPIKKLSLGMLKKDDTTKKDEDMMKVSEQVDTHTTEDIQTDKKEDDQTHITKINLKRESLRSEQQEDENIVKIEGETHPVENLEKTENGEESISAKKEEKDEDEEKIEEEKHTIASPEENHDNTAVINAVIGITEEEKTEEETESDKTEEVHFQNYESSFKNQSTKVIEKIRNFRYTPKTRKGLVLSLIVFVSCFISGIMIFIPNHPLNEYKANLLEAYYGIEGKQDTKDPLVSNNPFPEVKREDEGNNEFSEDIDEKEEDEISNEESNLTPTEKETRRSEKKKEVLRNHLLEKYSNRY